MRSTMSTLAVLRLVSLAHASPVRRQDPEPGSFVRLPLTYRAEEKFPTVDIGLGSPEQAVRVILNTGSSSLWVNPPCSIDKTCPTGDVSRTFDTGRSSSWKDFHFIRAEHYRVTAEYRLGQDRLMLGSAAIPDQVFGVGYSFSMEDAYLGDDGLSREQKMHQLMPYGILGVGRVRPGGPYDYNNRTSVVHSLRQAKRIQSGIISIDVQGPDDDGSVIFGGVDVKKFSGPLKRHDMVEADQAAFNMDGISVSRPGHGGEELSQKLLVSLQTGAPQSNLPDFITRKLYKLYAVKHKNVAPHELHCEDAASVDGTVDFNFGGGVVVRVPAKELLVKATSPDGYCGFNLNPVLPMDNAYTLGNDILKHAYFVVNEARATVHVASSKNCGSEVVGLKAGSSKEDATVGLDSVHGK